MEPYLPPIAVELLQVFTQGLQQIMGHNLYGIYLYGASVFPDAGPLQDIDCHVIIRKKLTEDQVAACRSQHQDLKQQYPGWAEKLDAYTILLEDAKGYQIPQHQILPEVYDYAWALHCAHIRAGFYYVLFGQEPTDIFPTPSWQAVESALAQELQFVCDHPEYPAYGILNLCRILYSYNTRNPAVSKQFSGRWGRERFPQWSILIQAAQRFYQKEHTPQDLTLMETQREEFYAFMLSKIVETREDKNNQVPESQGY